MLDVTNAPEYHAFHSYLSERNSTYRVKEVAKVFRATPRLATALKEIAEWPNGGNRYGQKNIKEFARAALREAGVES